MSTCMMTLLAMTPPAMHSSYRTYVRQHNADSSLERAGSGREDVHLGGYGSEGRVLADVGLQRRQFAVSRCVTVQNRFGHMIGDGTDTVAGQHGETCASHEADQLIMIESIGVGECSTSLTDVASKRLGEHGGMALRDEQAQYPARSQHPGHGLQRVGCRVDHLQHPMTDHDIDSVIAHQADQIAGISLHATHPAAQTGFGRATVERRQSVGTRVDDGDRMTLAGQRGRKAARPTAEIDDVQRPKDTWEELANLRVEELQQEALRH